MKLKQQIMADSWDYEFPISNIQANHIVDLADEFAIGFVQWLFHIDKNVLEKQLKEFKIEKGL